MTALVFLAALIAAYLHWSLAEVGWLLWGDVTIYVAAFTATLAAACVAAVVSGDRRCLVGALVLIVNYVGSHYAWTTSDPILAGACNDLVTAGVFILLGVSRWELVAGGIFLTSVAAAGLTALGWVPSHLERDPVFIAWSYPDIVALLGHGANIVLGLGAGDAGRRIASALRPRPLVFGYRRELVARMVALAKGARKIAED